MSLDWADDNDCRRLKAAGLTGITKPELDSLFARIDNDRERICHYAIENARLATLETHRWYVRRELEVILGTEDIAEAVELIKRWKQAYDFQVAATAQMEAINASP